MQGFHANGIFEGKNGGKYGESRGAMQTTPRLLLLSKPLISSVFHALPRGFYAPGRRAGMVTSPYGSRQGGESKAKLRRASEEGKGRWSARDATDGRSARELAWEQGGKGGTSVPPFNDSLLGELFRFLRQAVNVGGEKVNLVVTQILLLSRHLAIATMADGLLQLGQA